MEKIKELREKTGAGMVDCKKALDDSGGDIEKAIEILRKKGIAKAAKRGDRETSEGIILVDTNADNNIGYIVKFNSETDFVAKNDKFQEFSRQVFELIKKEEPSDMDALLSLEIDGIKVKEVIDNLSGVIGEKLTIADFEILKSDGTVSAYSHLGGKIGVLVELDKNGLNDLGLDVAMQVAAADPRYLSPQDVEEDFIKKEKEVYKEQLLKEGKPENIIENILKGKVQKLYSEVCLTKQEFIKDDKKSVEEILNDAKILKFVRYSL